MRFYHCMCLEFYSFGSMGPPACESCEKCGTHPIDDGHRYIYENKESYKKFREKYIEMWKDTKHMEEIPPEEMTWPKPKPHEWVINYVSTDNGEQPLTTCRMCGEKKSAV